MPALRQPRTSVEPRCRLASAGVAIGNGPCHRQAAGALLVGAEVVRPPGPCVGRIPSALMNRPPPNLSSSPCQSTLNSSLRAARVLKASICPAFTHGFALPPAPAAVGAGHEQRPANRVAAQLLADLRRKNLAWMPVLFRRRCSPACRLMMMSITLVVMSTAARLSSSSTVAAGAGAPCSPSGPSALRERPRLRIVSARHGSRNRMVAGSSIARLGTGSRRPIVKFRCIALELRALIQNSETLLRAGRPGSHLRLPL